MDNNSLNLKYNFYLKNLDFSNLLILKVALNKNSVDTSFDPDIICLEHIWSILLNVEMALNISAQDINLVYHN